MWMGRLCCQQKLAPAGRGDLKYASQKPEGQLLLLLLLLLSQDASDPTAVFNAKRAQGDPLDRPAARCRCCSA
jgi:hypothetical protein